MVHELVAIAADHFVQTRIADSGEGCRIGVLQVAERIDEPHGLRHLREDHGNQFLDEMCAVVSDIRHGAHSCTIALRAHCVS
ncbi:hypothetical protein GCM10022288_21050 [Gryllotalpicola kribbensis]|uniref:Uncharacterized protein n=1 Tax=Gryllotalpicola kribbensis TaxID=993084 RepID=A0ABP8AUL4_9MICO